jgi:hypothetical protein
VPAAVSTTGVSTLRATRFVLFFAAARFAAAGFDFFAAVFDTVFGVARFDVARFDVARPRFVVIREDVRFATRTSIP